LPKDDLRRYKIFAKDFLSLSKGDVEMLIQGNEYFRIGGDNG